MKLYEFSQASGTDSNGKISPLEIIFLLYYFSIVRKMNLALLAWLINEISPS